jgi:hypothetical protein
MAWNWITNIARYCRVSVSTEPEFCKEIQSALPKVPDYENNSVYFESVVGE